MPDSDEVSVATFSSPVFADLASTPAGKAIWKLLNDRVLALVTASMLGHAALDGVVLELEAEFGEHLGDDRVRRMVGAMIREILAQEGWSIEGQNVKLQLGTQFSVATRYHRFPPLIVEPGRLSKPGEQFLQQVGRRFDVEWGGRHYVEIPAGGATVGVDDLQSGVRRVHIFSNRKARTDVLMAMAPAVDALGENTVHAPKLTFHNDLGVRSHDRRYLGWHWTKANAGTQAEQVQMAVELTELLRTTWRKHME
jgi:hypothetical protein